jgi:hypothetical protein
MNRRDLLKALAASTIVPPLPLEEPDYVHDLKAFAVKYGPWDISNEALYLQLKKYAPAGRSHTEPLTWLRHVDSTGD